MIRSQTSTKRTGIRKPERGATRHAILDTAIWLFAKRGYAETTLEDVVAATGVTRGALYHHFADKKALFREVCRQLLTDIRARLDSTIRDAGDPWEAVVKGVRTSIDLAFLPAVRRILYNDRIAILSWEEWNEIAQETVGVSLQDAIKAAMDAGVMRKRPVVPLYFLWECAISRITTVAAESKQLSLNDVHAEFDDLLSLYRMPQSDLPSA